MLARFLGRKDERQAAPKEPVKPARPPVTAGVGKPANAQGRPLQARPAQERPPAAPRPVAVDEGEATPMRGIAVPATVRDPATRAAARVPSVPSKGREPPREPLKGDGVDELQEIDQFAGRVLTGDGGEVPLQNTQRKYVAALDNGMLLIAKDHRLTGPASSAQALLQRASFVAVRTLYVDMETIRKVYEAERRRSGNVEVMRDQAQMQRAVIELVKGAAKERCSDIHIIVRRHEAEVRVRSDSVMMKLRDMAAATAQDFCQAAFNMADASDSSYKPYEYQGARITALKSPLPENVQAVRLQFNPLPDGGRYLVMRLLYAQKVGADQDVDELGYTQAQIKQIKRMRRKSFGINIISGPTGSGKSTTLQRSLGAGLREVNYEKNVITVEDPPEYEIFGAAQLPVVNAKTDEERREAFRQAITASLRSDPDIVMIGEIRDNASAGLAFQAAMTGHQVWASLHANDGLSILDRLRDMGVVLYRLSDHTLVTGLIGQRLVRTLCKECKLPWDDAVERGFLDGEQARFLCEAVGEGAARTGFKFANPAGCERCRGGTTGRTVVAEVVLPDRKFMEFVAKEMKIQAYEYWLEHLQGVTMLENGLLKSVAGLVDPREVEDKIDLLDVVDPKRMRRLVGGDLSHLSE